MPLDPQASALLATVAAAGFPPRNTLPVEEARRLMVAQRALAGPVQLEAVANVEDRAIPIEGYRLPIRVYTPEGQAPFPILMYFHGGGWVLGSLESHDAVCRGLANRGGCVVVSVEYRLAPEHAYPTAAEDAYAATRWAAENAAEIGGDGTRLAVGGDSAGGNLAAAVTLMARARGGPALAYQLLVYPVTDHVFDTPSYLANAEGYMLSRADMIWFWDHYVPDHARRGEPYAAPLRAEDLAGLPPAMVITAEYDPLRDEGEAYADRLEEAGVAVESVCYPGMIHGFIANAAALDSGKVALRESGRALRSAFG